jgi:hypothetical protein
MKNLIFTQEDVENFLEKPEEETRDWGKPENDGEGTFQSQFVDFPDEEDTQ